MVKENTLPKFKIRHGTELMLFYLFGFFVLVDRTRTQAVVSHLVQAYWAPLWEWLVRDREEIFKHYEVL